MELKQKQGALYCVGVGPGDPELLTLKALRAIARCPVVAAPQTGDGRMLALEIAAAAAPLEGKRILPLPLPMTRDPATQAEGYRQAAGALAEALGAGQDVALLNLGDVSLYATATTLAALARQQGFAVHSIPGVPSFCAAAARLELPLAEKQEPLHILPAGANEAETEAALALPGTKVLMKAGRSLPRLAALLGRRGLAEHSALVANCGLPGETVCPSLANAPLPEQAGYFVTVIVKE